MTIQWKKCLPVLGCAAALVFTWICFSGDLSTPADPVDNSSIQGNQNTGFANRTPNEPKLPPQAPASGGITRALTDQDLQFMQSLPPMPASELPDLELSQDQPVPRPNTISEPEFAQSSFHQPDADANDGNSWNPEARIGVELTTAQSAAEPHGASGGDFGISPPLATTSESPPPIKTEHTVSPVTTRQNPPPVSPPEIGSR